MTDDMERLIGLAVAGDAGPLPGMEATVWARIGARRDRARMGQIRIAAVALALVVGVVNGGLMLLAPRPEPSEMRIFTVASGLSPLSSLDVRG